MTTHLKYLRVDESQDFLKVISFSNIATIIRQTRLYGGWEVVITYYGGAQVILTDEEFKKFWDTVKNDIALSYGGNF